MTAFRTILAAAAATLALALPLAAQDHPEGIHIHDIYARVNGGMGKTGAVFFMIHNNTATDDRLIDAKGEVAKKIELHTHKDMGEGVMKMVHVPEGFPVAAGDMHELARGGDHVMLMGLTADLKNGDHFPLVLVFEQAGEVSIDVTVDNDRGADGMGQMQHKHGMQSGG